eukprot:Rmarinus@m.17870
MANLIGKPAPAFTAPAVSNNDITKVSLSDYKGKWVVLFFYPKDFTFVCPTEIIAFSEAAEEFKALNTHLIACSTDTEECHLAWVKQPRRQGGLGEMKIPIIADTTKKISREYNVLLEEEGIALRGLFVIDPEQNIQQVTVNNLPVGRSVEETKRLIQAFQFTREHGEVCPANWRPGAKTMKANPKESLEYFEAVNK